ncbi:hypothetical protein RhiirA5_435196 [Rhizophagus irregularis]|uniref:Protein kinase domain-containing protein n=1 Tax=Rhizophagus irregularis TaxID=588596 RepID=A0A2N0NNS9_9GLOM|nr:hypothetical protein RhiirA5_435196 [Rhizophagus irregularis]
MIIQLANQGNLRCVLSSNFDNVSWNEKLNVLYDIAHDLANLHQLEYFHKNFRSGNILQNCKENNDEYLSYIICGVLPYIDFLTFIVYLVLEICNGGIRPVFGKGTPEIYKKLAYGCMSANSDQRPTASEL